MGLAGARCERLSPVLGCRITEHSSRREGRIAAGHDGSIDASRDISRAALNDATVIVDLDLAPGHDTAPRLDAACLTFVGEIFARPGSGRKSKENQTESI